MNTILLLMIDWYVIKQYPKIQLLVTKADNNLSRLKESLFILSVRVKLFAEGGRHSGSLVWHLPQDPMVPVKTLKKILKI